MDKQALLSKKHFCILPFISSRIWHGVVSPCCVNHDVIFGKTNETPIDEIYNEDNNILNDFRKQMLTGPELPKSCSRCIDLEKNGVSSMRLYSNKFFEHVIDKVEFNEDGVVKDMKIYLIDGIGFNNLCNLKCRMCPSYLSTTNREEEVRFNLPIKKMTAIQQEFVDELTLPPVFIETFNDTNEFYSFFENRVLDTIEEIKFEGGEPLMVEEHYKVLEYLIENNRTDVRIRYCTNLTRIKLKQYDIFDLWKKFTDVSITVSLDSVGEKNHYIRHPSKWEDVVNNINRLKQECPHVTLSVNTTMQLLNSFSMVELHKWLLENKIPQKIIYLKNPSNMSMNVLPPEFKSRVVAHWEEYKKTINNSSDIDGFLRMMLSEDSSNELDDFLNFTKERDIVRGENFYETFPEFKDLK